MLRRGRSAGEVVRIALLRLLITAVAPAAVAGAGRQQRRVALAGRPTDHNGWTLVFPASGHRQPMATTRDDLTPLGPRGEPVPSLALAAGVLIGYACCSTDKQDLAAQRHTLRQLGVSEDRVYLDHGMTGRNRRRPGLQQALAAVRQGDTLVVPKLDRLARSVPDARAIGDSLAAGEVRLSIGGTVYDPTDPMGKMFFNILATFAEFEVDLLRMRTLDHRDLRRALPPAQDDYPEFRIMSLAWRRARSRVGRRWRSWLGAPPTRGRSRLAASISASTSSASRSKVTVPSVWCVRPHP
jgi:hypothetical protein